MRRMFQHAALCPYLPDSPNGQLGFVWRRLGERSQASPGPTRWMADDRHTAGKRQSVTVDIVTLAPRQPLVSTVLPHEQYGYLRHDVTVGMYGGVFTSTGAATGAGRRAAPG